MIQDPLAAIIGWLTTAVTTAGGRVASKHRYGETWLESQAGLSVHWDGGPVDIYAPLVRMRLELRIYAADQVKITEIWRELIILSRANRRFAQAGTLIHTFLPATSLSHIYDDTLGMDMGVVFFDAIVAEEAIP